MKKKKALLVTVLGIMVFIPLPQTQGTTSSLRLQNFQTNTAHLIESKSSSSEQKDYQHILASPYLIDDYVLSHSSALQPAAQVADGELVTYKAFDGTTYLLQQFTGKYTAILWKPEDLDLYTLPRLRELLDQCDLLYAHYKEIIPTEPAGEGVTSIAFVKNCGLGCGRLGSKGIEVDPKTLRPEEVSAYSVIVHEMAHNFDRYSSFIMVGPDPPHAWTAFWESYIPFYSGGTTDPFAAFSRFVNRILDEYLSSPTATWGACVKDNRCEPKLHPNILQSILLLRAVQLFGPAVVAPWLERVHEASRSLSASSMSPLDKSDVLVETLSQAINANTLCFFDSLRWSVSDSLRSKLQRRFEDSAVCTDQDNDGFSLMRGDFDDANSLVHPGATEVVNGIDDDCNRIIDDLPFSESGDFPNTVASALQLPIPCRVLGTISSATDFDHFQVNFPTKSTVILSLKGIDDFSGWLYYYKQGGTDVGNSSHLIKGTDSTQLLTLPAGTWNIAIAVTSPPNFSHYATELGSYEIGVQPVVEDPGLPIIPPARTKRFNDYILTAPPIPQKFSGRPNVIARFWVSNIGWVGSAQASSSAEASFEWIAPPGTMPETLWYRVQYYQDAMPLTSVTLSASITTEHDPVSGPVINSGTFDGIKTLTIAGVRFSDAPQVIINYVDRSSAIKSVSDNRLTLRAKAKKLGLKPGDNLIQVYTSNGSASNVIILRH
jgi:hypothetical protein